MTAPSIKEALKRARKYIWLDTNVLQTKTAVLAEIDAALATLQPDGERREAIARIIYDAFPFDPPCEFHPETGERVLKPAWIDRGNSVRQDDARRAADKILASGLVQDEAGIRRDEREKCADQADAHVVKEFDDAWIIARAIRNRNAVEIAKSSGTKVHPRIAAIRSARNGGGS